MPTLCADVKRFHQLINADQVFATHSPSADSEEKHEPASDIDTAVMEKSESA
jgi:hypothetical protein